MFVLYVMLYYNINVQRVSQSHPSLQILFYAATVGQTFNKGNKSHIE